MLHFLTNMIKFFMLKSNGKRAKIGHVNKGRKVDDEVLEKKSQKAGTGITKENINVSETVYPCRKETHQNRGVPRRERVAEWF